jgi:uncharacterized protein YdcH (DUF465 family)
MPTFTKEHIKEIAEQIDCGFRAFYHLQTGDLLFIPDTLKYPEIETKAWREEIKELKKNSNDYAEIEAMDSSDSIELMRDFTELLDDSNPLKKKLTTALTNKKPFREFKFVIDNSGEYRQQWFDFKNLRLQQWVENQIDQST